MWLKPGGRAMRFTAVQELTIERIEFSWRARFPLMGPLALSVVDAYDGEKGELAVRVVGLPLQRQRGPETTAGQAIRYPCRARVGTTCDPLQPGARLAFD